MSDPKIDAMSKQKKNYQTKDVLRYNDFIQQAVRKSALLGISLNQLVQRAVEKELREP